MTLTGHDGPDRYAIVPVNILSPRVAQKQTDLRIAPKATAHSSLHQSQYTSWIVIPLTPQLRVKTTHKPNSSDAAVTGNLSAHKDPNARLRTRTAAHDYLSANTCCDPQHSPLVLDDLYIQGQCTIDR